MIRINLIGERKKQRMTLKPPPGPPQSSLMLLLLAAVIVAGGGYLYWRYQALTHESESLKQQLDEAQREKQRRQNLLNAIEVFEKRKKVLDARISVITELKKNQSGPIEWLNALSTAVDRSQSAWLTSLDQKGNHFTIEGVATSLPGVANFATALKGTGLFTNVSIDETEQTNVSGLDGYSFTVSFDTKSSGSSTKS